MIGKTSTEKPSEEEDRVDKMKHAPEQRLWGRNGSGHGNHPQHSNRPKRRRWPEFPRRRTWYRRREGSTIWPLWKVREYPSSKPATPPIELFGEPPAPFQQFDEQRQSRQRISASAFPFSLPKISLSLPLCVESGKRRREKKRKPLPLSVPVGVAWVRQAREEMKTVTHFDDRCHTSLQSKLRRCSNQDEWR